jgi:threonine dehydrogenase-like Zn-dependent dehydrogenase
MIQKIPNALSFKHAAVANCACGCTYTATEELGVGTGDWVMVAGIGFIGFGAIINAKYRGAKVIALGRNDYRMDLAQKLGADIILNPEDPEWLAQLHEITGHLKGVDACVECSGYPFYQYKCLEAVRRYGKVFHLGFIPGSNERLPIHVLDQIINRHIWITGGHDVRFKDREGLLRMLLEPSVQAKIDLMVTHEFPMSRAREAFEAALSKKCGKIYLLPWE